MTIERPSASFRAIQWSKPEKIHLNRTVDWQDPRITEQAPGEAHRRPQDTELKEPRDT